MGGLINRTFGKEGKGGLAKRGETGLLIGVGKGESGLSTGTFKKKLIVYY